MFDRSRNERAGPVSVEIALRNGRDLKGRLTIPPGRTLAEVLNGGNNFVEFESFAGERAFIAKAAVLTLKPLDLPQAPTLGAGSGALGSFDPCTVLGIGPDADRNKVRQAYIALAKIYHPDRYATADLPAEVRDYLSAMARRINAAYDALETSRPEASSPHVAAGAVAR